MSQQLILCDVNARFATVTLNRPDKLNAMTKPMWLQLGEVVLELSERNDLRCIVLKGAGEKSFSPGNDISEFETERANKEQGIAYGRIMENTLRALKSCRHPTVAQIHGICIGGGMEIAGCCDIRICGQSSRFGAPIKNLGLVMAYEEISSLVSLVGKTRATEILLEGRIYSAEEAREIGIVTRMVSDDLVSQEVTETVQRICEGAPLAARWHKKFLRRLDDPSPLSHAEWEEGFECYGTEDFQTGRKAFVAKTKPDFKGQ
jgi:enoyl-CoA hydratase